MEIISYGQLPRGVSIEKFKEDPDKLRIDPHRRNSVLVDIFIDMELMEADARGVRRILRSCEKANLRLPVWIENESTVTVKFWRPDRRLPSRHPIQSRPSQGGHVFISYARKDGLELAQKLDTELQNSGFATWRDKRDIDPMQDFSAEIEKAIENASHILVCVTPDSRRADSFVRREIQYALALRKPIIPLTLNDTLPPITLATLTQINVTDLSWDKSLEALKSRLLQNEDLKHQFISQNEDPYREYLTALYQSIVRYLDLTVFSLVTLRGEAIPDATEKRQILPTAFWSLAGVISDQEKGIQPQYDSLGTAFDRYDGRILLLGEPGAGKTTTLFTFARDKVAARLADPTLPLPILAPIATWNKEKYPQLSQWLSELVPALKTDEVAKMINDGKLLLLLDGLDELDKEQQDSFMQLLPTRSQIIVTCRTVTYFDLNRKISLNGAVSLQTLTDEQMKTYLRDLPDLWAALESDDGLREMVRTPLLLSLFVFAFRDLPEDVRRLRDLNLSDLRDKIFATYVSRRYEREQRKLMVKNEQIAFTLAELYQILAQLALEISNRPDDEIKTNDFAATLEENRIKPFIELVSLLNLIVSDNNHRYRFANALLRDHFASYKP